MRGEQGLRAGKGNGTMGGSFWDDLKSTAGNLVDKASETIKETAGRAELEVNVIKINRSIGLVDREIEELHQKMGAVVWGQYKEGQIEDEELKALCYQIEGLEKRIEGYRQEIEKMRKEALEAEKARSETSRSAGEKDDGNDEDGEEVDAEPIEDEVEGRKKDEKDR